MVSRSREEVRFASYLLQFLGHRAAYVDVLDALRAGCERGLFDIYLEPLELYIEYDGGYFHGHQRADRDAQKCLEKVLHEPHARVLRVRVGNAAELPQTQHARIAVVLARDFDTAVGAACRALATLVNAPRLAQVPARLVRCAERELVADQVLDQLNLNLSQQRAELVHGLGESAARRLAARGGALTRMQHGQFAQAVIRFMGELHLSVRQLLTVLVPSTLARIEAPEFVGAVRQFAADFELSTAQLVTLLGTGSVASRVEDTSFTAAVRQFAADFGLNTAQLVTLLGNGSVAARVERASFAPAVRQLGVVANLSSDELVAHLNQPGVAVRVDSLDFATALAALPQPRTRKRVRELCDSLPRSR